MPKTALTMVQKYYPGVTTVRDAKRPRVIQVTPEDCKRGNKKEPADCALAKAFKRKFDGAIISTSKSYLIKGKIALRYDTPESVSREVISFDRNHNFEPGQYHLAPVAKANKLGARNRPQYSKKRKPGYPKIKKRNHLTGGIRSIK